MDKHREVILPLELEHLEVSLRVIFAQIFSLALRVYGILQEGASEEKFGVCNASGEEQLALDVLADKVIFSALSGLSVLHSLCSEEQENVTTLNPLGQFSVAYDPLDGSSLMGANLSVGSIFGIYSSKDSGDGFRAENLVASAYAIYGIQLGVVLTTKRDKKVWYFLFNGEEFIYKQTLSLQQKGKINATGGTQKEWSESHRKAIWELFERGYRLRYSGGMVPDLHHILIKAGGIFSYPATLNNPHGKLRALFEVFPFAQIFENANGLAFTRSINGEVKPLLECHIEHIHQRLPCYFGSREEVEFVTSFGG